MQRTGRSTRFSQQQSQPPLAIKNTLHVPCINSGPEESGIARLAAACLLLAGHIAAAATVSYGSYA
jgi:hypothetical protein